MRSGPHFAIIVILNFLRKILSKDINPKLIGTYGNRNIYKLHLLKVGMVKKDLKEQLEALKEQVKKMKGKKLTCQNKKCRYSWMYKGNAKVYAHCPRCSYKVLINQNKKKK